MNYAPKCTRTDWGLRLEYQDSVSLTDSNLIRNLDIILKACRESQPGIVMIHASGARRDISLYKMLEVIEHIRGLGHATRFAIVSPELKRHPDSAFMTTAATNRGLRYGYYDTEEEALSALLHSPASNSEARNNPHPSSSSPSQSP